MAFFARQDIGRLYILKMVLPDDTIVHKIGMCNTDRVQDRMMEILRSWFMQYRFVPYTELRLSIETGYPKEFEAFIHKVLAPKRFIPHKKVSGGTEMFTDINEFRLIHYLKAFNEDNFKEGLNLTDNECSRLLHLICP